MFLVFLVIMVICMNFALPFEENIHADNIKLEQIRFLKDLMNDYRLKVEKMKD